MPEHPELGNRLKEMRLIAGLTQAELAAAVGVSRKTVNTVENGVFVPSTILALRISAALGVPVEQLFMLK
jgi:putative transcriptional regulator